MRQIKILCIVFSQSAFKMCTSCVSFTNDKNHSQLFYLMKPQKWGCSFLFQT